MRVLVTGANGHLGLALTAQLVEAGHQVRASIRATAIGARVPLQALRVEVVEADVLDAAAMERAAQNMEVVFHLAAPFRFVVKNPERELVEPAVRGAENALVAANKAGVRRVVMTSSTVALGGKHNPARPLDERDWNDQPVNAYAVAKTLAERNAWRVAEKLGVDLVCVNPCALMGPGFVRHTPNTLPVANLLAGEIPLAPPFSGNYVDVRDVARAHILAAETAAANGRYVLAGAHMRFMDLGKALKAMRPKAKVPTRELPAWLFPVAQAMDWMLHKTRGLPRQLSKDFIEEYRDGRVTFSATRAQRELGWSARPFEQTLRDTVEWIEQHHPPSW